MSAPPEKLVRVIAFVAPLLFLFAVAHPCLAQTTVATGSIVGRVSDPSGAVLIGAKVMITNVATGQVVNLATNSFSEGNSLNSSSSTWGRSEGQRATRSHF